VCDYGWTGRLTSAGASALWHALRSRFRVIPWKLAYRMPKLGQANLVWTSFALRTLGRKFLLGSTHVDRTCPIPEWNLLIRPKCLLNGSLPVPAESDGRME
jgi:hypothetical protein